MTVPHGAHLCIDAHHVTEKLPGLFHKKGALWVNVSLVSPYLNNQRQLAAATRGLGKGSHRHCAWVAVHQAELV